jgi:DNA helicase-2/ATP-dependent DNA helicase PcrA
LIAKASEELGASNVIVASLTRAASRELLGRSLPVDENHVGTLHAICYRALGRGPILDADSKLLKEFTETYGRPMTGTKDGLDLLSDEPTGNDEALKHMNLLRLRMVSRELWPSHVTAFADDWDSFKMFKGAVDFVGMIERALERLPAPPDGVRAVYYDEAQDGSALELALISQWAAHTEYTRIAGDDRQAIFTWRGASPEAFLAFSQERKYLEQSYRIPRAVHVVAQRLASTLAVGSPQEYRPRDAEGEVVPVPWLSADPSEWLPQLLSLDGSVMVLATCRYMLAPVISCLKEAGVPFHNPFAEDAGQWNPLARHAGISSADRLAAFCRLTTWRDLTLATDHLRAELLPRGSKAVIAGHKGDTAPVPFELACDLVGDDMLDAAIHKDLDWYERGLLPSKAHTLAFALRCARRMGIATLARWVDEVQGQPRKGLTVGTVHSVKGGEADTVLLFPDLSPAAFEQYDSSDRDTVTRTMYVGVTRARERLLLGSPRGALAFDWPR